MIAFEAPSPVSAALHREVWNAALEALRTAGSGTGDFRVEKAWPLGESGGPGLSVLALVGGPGKVLRRGAALWLGSGGALPRVVERALEKGRAQRLDVPGPTVAVTWSVDRDPALPVLRRRLRDPGRWLEADGAGAMDYARAELVAIKPLRRAMVRLTGRRAGTPVTRYVKLLRERDLEQVLGSYRVLARAAGEAGDAPWSAPETLAGDDPGLVWRPIPGTPLTELLGTEAQAAAIAAAARALAALHRSPVVLPSRHGRWREIETVTRWADLASLLYPASGGPLAAAAAGLAEQIRSRPLHRLRPAHRDFHDGQVLVTGTGDAARAALLDLDTAALAEPELDVDNFLAHLHLRGCDPAAQIAFREAYREAGGPSLDDEALAFYRIASELRLSCVYRFRPVPESRWRRFAAGALERAHGPSRRYP